MKSLYESIVSSNEVSALKESAKRVTDYLIAEKLYRTSFLKVLPTEDDFKKLSKATVSVWEPNFGKSDKAYEEDWWLTYFQDLIKRFIKCTSYKCSLNWIDVSKVKRLNAVFSYSKFNGDISKWDVSNVEDMQQLFRGSVFNGDISKWNVGNVRDMDYMFEDSEFNKDISKWKLDNLIRSNSMFENSNFNKDISKWNIPKLKFHDRMFEKCDIKEEYKPKGL